MALSNTQYDEIMREYQERQLRNRHLTQKREEEAYTRFPALKSIDDKMAEISVESARKMLDGDTQAFNQLKIELALSLIHI